MKLRQPSIILASVVAHGFLIVALIAISIVAPDILPTPRDVLAAPAERITHLPDIPLPAARRTRTASSPAVAPVATTPLTMPEGIAPEVVRETIDRGVADGVAALESTGGSVTGIGLAAEAPPPAPSVTPAPVRLHSGIAAPVKIRDVAPSYPDLARQAGIQGVVIIEVVISETGEVTSAKVLRSVRLLDEAALAAVRAWTFEPARLNGDTIPVVMTVTVNFSLR